MDFWVDLKNIKYPDPDEIHAAEIAAVKDRFGEGAEYHWSDREGAVMVRVFHQNPVFDEDEKDSWWAFREDEIKSIAEAHQRITEIIKQQEEEPWLFE